MQITSEISEIEFRLAGNFNLVSILDTLDLKAGVHCSRLNSLNDLLRTNPHPLQSSEILTELTLRKNGSS